MDAILFLTLPYHGIDPVAFWVGPVPVRWYGLAYAFGLAIGWLYIRNLLADQRLWLGPSPLTVDQVDSLLLWMTIGIVVGGRLGAVLLYQPSMLWTKPLEVLAPWNGGMAFHGGLIGVILALLAFGRRHGVSPLRAGDLVCTALPIGLLLGRIANFINGELWGRVSSVPWAMVFPEAGPEPRHPSQLYEAFLEGLVLFVVIRFLTHQRGALNQPGLICGVFLMGYGLARTFCEFYREGEKMALDPSGTFTLGMLYSLPMIVAGLYLLRWSRKRDGVAV